MQLDALELFVNLVWLNYVTMPLVFLRENDFIHQMTARSFTIKNEIKSGRYYPK